MTDTATVIQAAIDFLLIGFAIGCLIAAFKQ